LYFTTRRFFITFSFRQKNAPFLLLFDAMRVKTAKINLFDQYSDEELVRYYIENQDNRYFENLYERYSQKVYQKCISLVKDSAIAEDLTHDIFFKVITKLSTFKEDSRFSTWLYSITYNQCMDQLRVIKKRGENNMDEKFDYPDGDAPDLDVIFEGGDIEIKRLKQAMDKLNAEEKGVLMMKYQDDLSIKEIAGIFKATESAVKMRLLRSREKLRKNYMDLIVLLGMLLGKLSEVLKYIMN